MATSRRPVFADASLKRSGSTTSKGRCELLFEIGTEELPFQFVGPALQFLQQSMERLLQEHRLDHGRVLVMGTPRRLLVVVQDLASRQLPFLKETIGPPKSAAFSEDGHPTKAAIGFATSQAVDIKDLEVRQTPKGEYVCAVKRERGLEVHAVLKTILPTLLDSLSFPKSMKWNETGMRFARPIRWMVALCNKRVVPVTKGGVSTGKTTSGHRFLGKKRTGSRETFPVKDFNHYMKSLEARYVIADPNRRKSMIVSQLEKLAKSVRAVAHLDEDLIDKAVYSVEWPQAIVGSFDPAYLALPSEVLTTSMKEHQGFFPLAKKNGALVPRFISVTNMGLRDMSLIREGNERVLSARLADAKFFFEEDQKASLDDRLVQLKHMTFHQQLGNLRQKVERVRELAKEIPGMLDAAHLNVPLTRAASLCKSDLLTGMVGEFPTLQGIMGGAYARLGGEDEDVCLAIQDHYLPKGMEDTIPRTTLGKMLSLADRLDTLAAFFHINMIPSGSEDPLGLRRHASAIVRIIVEGGMKIDLIPLIEHAWRNVEKEGFQPSITQDHTRTHPPWTPLVDFISDRLRFYGRTVLGFREDVMEAILRSSGQGPFDLVDNIKRITALENITTVKEFDPLMIGFKRAHRLTLKEQWENQGIDPALFQHESERTLFAQLREASQRLPDLLARGDYAKGLGVLVSLKPAIDQFFEGVMVNAEDSRIRANRLSLLEMVSNLFASFADFSHIQVQHA